MIWHKPRERSRWRSCGCVGEKKKSQLHRFRAHFSFSIRLQVAAESPRKKKYKASEEIKNYKAKKINNKLTEKSHCLCFVVENWFLI
jgi:hypothetical protein